MRRLACAVLVLCAAALGGCARSAGTPAQQLSSWAGSSGIIGDDAEVIADVKGFEGALAAGKTLTAKTVCDALYDDASQAYDELPSPDEQVTNLLGDAFSELANGANNCDLALGGSENRTLLAQAERQIDEGSADLQAADRRLASFGISTTTVASGPTA